MEEKIKMYFIIIGVAIMLILIALEKEYIKKYKLYGSVLTIYIITVFAIYIILANLSSRNI